MKCNSTQSILSCHYSIPNLSIKNEQDTALDVNKYFKLWVKVVFFLAKSSLLLMEIVLIELPFELFKTLI